MSVLAASQTSSNSNSSAVRGKADGADNIYSNRHIAAGNSVNVKSGNNTSLQGAVISANTVNTDIGGKLNTESL